MARCLAEEERDSVALLLMMICKNCLRRPLSASIQNSNPMSKPSHHQHHLQRNLLVDAARQVLEMMEGKVVTATWPVSTSRFGLGFEEGSFRTPTGCFRIAEKIGDGAPAGMIFRSRIATGKVADQGGEEDLVLTRILWLEGLDPHNANTRQRYIYIHGTNQEHLIGTPASHGCIRLRNNDMIDLFDRVNEGTHVEIKS
jgi:lipoprotein-anchoring transpeptidase ErfK/SrfK